MAGNVAQFTFEVTGVGAHLRVLGFRCEEAISSPFECHLHLVVAEADRIAPADMINQPGVLTLIDTHGEVQRHIHGLVVNAQQQDATGRFINYSVQLVPQLWRLGLRHDCRIFQNLAVPDIIKSTIGSDSSKGIGSNELCFEELKSSEEVFLHVQKDWTIPSHRISISWNEMPRC